MIERIYILESVDPVIFYGVNNVNMQLIKTLFPKLRIVARGNVMKVIGDEEESELFLKKIREVEKYCEEFNSLSEDVILDIIKGKAPVITKQENLIIHGMNGKPIVARTENQQRLVKAFEENDVEKVVYGHLHANAGNYPFVCERGGIRYYLTSCDLLNFKLTQIY